MIDERLVEICFKSLKSEPFVCIYSEGGVIVILTPYIDDVCLLEKYLKVLGQVVQNLMNRFSKEDIENKPLVLGMGVTRDHMKETVTITQENYAKSLLELYGMASYNFTYTLGVKTEHVLD